MSSNQSYDRTKNRQYVWTHYMYKNRNSCNNLFVLRTLYAQSKTYNNTKKKKMFREKSYVNEKQIT